MTKPKDTRTLVLICLGLVLALAGGLWFFRQPAAPPVPGVACASTTDCGPAHRCVVPGVCSRECTADRECPAGRTCAELRLMEPGRDDSSAAGTVTTCVVATPP